MDRIYTREVLESMGIHDLRTLGREVGVRQPTVLKKDELIHEIVRVSKEGPDPKKKKQGRPPLQPIWLADKTVDPADIKIVVDDYVPTPKASPAEKPEDGQPNEKPSETRHYTPRNSTYKPYGIYGNGNFGVPRETFNNNNNKQYNNYQRPNNNYNNGNGSGYNNGNSYGNGSYGNGNGNAFQQAQQTYGQGGGQNNSGAPNDLEAEMGELEIKEGVLEIMADGYGFLRAKNYEAGEMDAYVSAQKIKKCGLRKGDWVKAEARKIQENRPAGVTNLIEVNGLPPDSVFKRKNFDLLTPIYPDTRFKLEIPNARNDFAIRAIDLVAPIGNGQRAMIVSPPKAGKTTLLKKIANSISENYPKAHLIVLLIDERPEEVTDMRRSIKGEVVFSTFDEMPEHHTKAAELVLERAKRLVETGADVVILMDSLTRLARAYNLTIAPTGRTLSGGIDPGALHSPKRFFGAARNIEFGGSLTIIATALVDTGSRMDDVIYEEFKGTGNMEIHLDRKLSEKRIFPAIDLARSGTRREELLLDQGELQGVWAMRKMLGAGDNLDATEQLISMLVKTKTNAEFIDQLNLQILALQKQGFQFK